MGVFLVLGDAACVALDGISVKGDAAVDAGVVPSAAMIDMFGDGGFLNGVAAVRTVEPRHGARRREIGSRPREWGRSRRPSERQREREGAGGAEGGAEGGRGGAAGLDAVL